jgi:hypothetical protein
LASRQKSCERDSARTLLKVRTLHPHSLTAFSHRVLGRQQTNHHPARLPPFCYFSEHNPSNDLPFLDSLPPSVLTAIELLEALVDLSSPELTRTHISERPPRCRADQWTTWRLLAPNASSSMNPTVTSADDCVRLTRLMAFTSPLEQVSSYLSTPNTGYASFSICFCSARLLGWPQTFAWIAIRLVPRLAEGDFRW